jgi:hypothetical protein
MEYVEALIAAICIGTPISVKAEWGSFCAGLFCCGLYLVFMHNFV